jgi:hypothetical protein
MRKDAFYHYTDFLSQYNVHAIYFAALIFVTTIILKRQVLIMDIILLLSCQKYTYA